jgi:AbrB family looped-hinge helix DNA binding protein
MYEMTVTSVSTKGQIVIPESIRKLMGIEAGAKMMVLTDGANVMLKPITNPNMAEFERMAKASRQYARKMGLKKSDVKEAIQKVRRHDRSA